MVGYLVIAQVRAALPTSGLNENFSLLISEQYAYVGTNTSCGFAPAGVSTIDISHLQPGMYIVEVVFENMKIRQKLLVQR